MLKRKSPRALQKTRPSQSPMQKLAKSGVRRSKLFPESQVQKAGLEWLRLYNLEVRRSVIKIHNEGRRTAASTALLISLGLHPGASDLLVAWPTRKYAGLWLEVKREKWKPTTSDREHFERQLAFGELMISRGYAFEVAIGLDQFIAKVTAYLET